MNHLGYLSLGVLGAVLLVRPSALLASREQGRDLERPRPVVLTSGRPEIPNLVIDLPPGHRLDVERSKEATVYHLTLETLSCIASDGAHVHVYVGPSPKLLAPSFEGSVNHREYPIGSERVLWSVWVSEEDGIPTMNYEAIVDGLFATGSPSSPEHVRGLKVHLLLTAGSEGTTRQVLRVASTLRAMQ